MTRAGLISGFCLCHNEKLWTRLSHCRTRPLDFAKLACFPLNCLAPPPPVPREPVARTRIARGWGSSVVIVARGSVEGTTFSEKSESTKHKHLSPPPLAAVELIYILFIGIRTLCLTVTRGYGRVP